MKKNFLKLLRLPVATRVIRKLVTPPKISFHKQIIFDNSVFLPIDERDAPAKVLLEKPVRVNFSNIIEVFQNNYFDIYLTFTNQPLRVSFSSYNTLPPNGLYVVDGISLGRVFGAGISTGEYPFTISAMNKSGTSTYTVTIRVIPTGSGSGGCSGAGVGTSGY